LPFIATTELALKFVPVSERVKAVSPANLLAGDKALSVGMGLFRVSVKGGVDVPPPGVGFVTVTAKSPLVTMLEAGMCALNWVVLRKFVTTGVPAKLTTEVGMKSLPETLKVTSGPPAGALAGSRLVAIGTGLLTVNISGVETPPPGAGFVTVTGKIPPLTICAAEMCAVNSDGLKKVVTTGTPAKLTTDAGTKLLPVTLRIRSGPPAAALAGSRVVAIGAGLLIVNISGVDSPPVGAGSKTVTESVPAEAISDVSTTVVNCVESTKIVVLCTLLIRIEKLSAKPEP